MMSFSDSVLARILQRLARIVHRCPKQLVYWQIALFALSLIVTIYGLKLDMARNDLIGKKSRVHQVYLQFQKEFPGGSELAVVVQSESPERNAQFVERLGARIKAEPRLFADTFYKADLISLGSKALLLASTNDLKEMRQALRVYRPFLQEFAETTNLNSLFALVNDQFRNMPEEHAPSADWLTNTIPFLERTISEATQTMLQPGVVPSIGIEAFLGVGGQAQQQIYVTYDHGRTFVLTTRARTAAVEAAAIDRLRALLEETKTEVPGLNAGLTGEPVLDYDEMRQAERDSILASIVSLVLCSLVFIMAYRETGRPIKTALCLIIGLGFAMGFATVAIGHLNILTITFAPMLIGLAIDFGIHFTTRYEEEMRRGCREPDAVTKAMVFTGQGIVTGALTTAAAFLAMALTRFKGIQEMGLISGGGLLLCLVPMMTLLPLLLMRGRQNRRDREMGDATKRRIRIEDLWLRRPWAVVTTVIALCAAAALLIPGVSFDYDLLHMQSPGLSSVMYERQMLQASDRSLLFAAVMADSPVQALEYEAKLRQLPAVADVESVAHYITEDQRRKLELVRTIKKEVAEIHFTPPDPRPVEIHKLSATLWYLTGYLGLGAEMAQQADPALARNLASLRDAISRFRVVMLSDQPNIQESLTRFQQALFRSVDQTFAAIQNQDTREPLRPQDLPPALRDRFVGRTGKLLLQVHSKHDLWQHDNQREFIRQLQSVIPQDRISGTPIELYEYTTLLKQSYQYAALYALLAIIVMVFAHFRCVSCVLLALLPVAIGTTWLLGFMAATGISFNAANIMTLPLVVGIGVTNGIQILNRFAEEQNPRILAKSTGKSVLVSGLTAIIGFGSLMLAGHRGIRSLGVVMSVGIASCMIAGLTFLPAVLILLMRKGWTIKLKEHSQP